MRLEKSLLELMLLLSTLALGTFALSACSSGVTSPDAAQTPSPALLVVVRGTNELAIVDPRTSKAVATVPFGSGGFPHEVAVSADGRLAFVTNDSYVGDADPLDNPEGIQGSFISVIDLVTQKVVRRIETGPLSAPHGIAFAGRELYVTAQGYRLVARYDPASNQINGMMGTGQEGTHMLVITKDAKKIFTANTDSNSVTALVERESPADYERIQGDSAPVWNITVIPVGRGPEGIAMSPDEKEVWVLTQFDDGLSIIDVATKKVSQTLNLKTGAPQRLQFTPDGKRVIILSGNEKGDEKSEVLVLDAVTRKEIKRIMNVGTKNNVDAYLHGVLITPDGSRAYVSDKKGNTVAVIDLKTLEVTGFITTGDVPESLAWAVRR